MLAKTIRTRYAPSPTGFMHVGNLRTALYEFLIAKSNGGKFILRIEDTDQERLVEGATEIIYKTLKDVDITHDEGPDVGGGYGPYVQSQRLDIYAPYARELVIKGSAYYCFCTKERLDSLKSAGSENDEKNFFGGYDRHCRNLSESEIADNLAKGIPYVIRQKMPVSGSTTFIDAVYGSITVENTELEDQVLLKSDGYPTYNFANVVDDHLMDITHVVRGSEYLSSTPKYNLLYESFGWEIPVYVHLPLIMGKNPDGTVSKLSKRHGSTSFEDLVKEGFLAPAIINYIALLGWCPKDNTEIMSMVDLVEKFTIDGISKSPAVFDYEKLRWVNADYIRRMSFEDFHNIAQDSYKILSSEIFTNSSDTPKSSEFSLCENISTDTNKSFQQSYEFCGINSDLNTEKISELLQSRISQLNEIKGLVAFFYNLPEYTADIYEHKKMKTDKQNSLENLRIVLPVIENLADWSQERIHDVLIQFAVDHSLKNGQVMWPIRTALSGLPSSPGGAVELLYILGKTESVKRIQQGIQLLEI